MTITLDPELARRLEETARARNTMPDAIVTEALEEKLPRQPEYNFTPQDDWERRLQSIGKDYGVSLSDEATRRENLYD